MKRLTALCWATWVFISPASSASANEVTGTKSLPVGRCINMGNHLEAPREGEWGRPIADRDFAIIAKAGFSTIRLPVRWSAHIDAKGVITTELLARVEHLVKTANGAGLNVILNDHNFDALMKDPEAQRDRLADIWRQIATRFASFPREKLWFEIENEPHDKLDNHNLIATLAPALAAIRASNPDRPVIIGGEFWSGIGSLASLSLPDDPNIVPTFHYYEPFDFTHQGAEWVNPVPPLGRRYGTEEDAARLKADTEKARAYVARTGLTPFMGEFGANQKVPLDQRIAYQKAVRTAFDSAGIASCAWAYANTFPLYDSNNGMWLPGMLDAMGLPAKEAGQ